MRPDAPLSYGDLLLNGGPERPERLGLAVRRRTHDRNYGMACPLPRAVTPTRRVTCPGAEGLGDRDRENALFQI
jgi:hypothetical protein